MERHIETLKGQRVEPHIETLNDSPFSLVCITNKISITPLLLENQTKIQHSSLDLSDTESGNCLLIIESPPSIKNYLSAGP